MARQGAAKEAANDTTRMELKTVVDNRTVGEILREARIARDEDYTDVSGHLRIRRAYMEAIEDGRFGDLPGSTYAIGFVRTYAEYLGLDVAKMVAKYKQEASDFEDQTKLVFPEPMPASRAPTASIIVVAIVLLFGSYAGWLYISNKDQDQIALVPPLPEALQNLIDRAGPVVDETETAAPAPAPQAETAAAPAAAPAAPVTEDTQSVAESAPAVESQEAPVVVNETIASAVPQSADQPEESVEAPPPPPAVRRSPSGTPLNGFPAPPRMPPMAKPRSKTPRSKTPRRPRLLRPTRRAWPKKPLLPLRQRLKPLPKRKRLSRPKRLPRLHRVPRPDLPRHPRQRSTQRP